MDELNFTSANFATKKVKEAKKIYYYIIPHINCSPKESIGHAKGCNLIIHHIHYTQFTGKAFCLGFGFWVWGLEFGPKEDGFEKKCVLRLIE